MAYMLRIYDFIAAGNVTSTMAGWTNMMKNIPGHSSSETVYWPPEDVHVGHRSIGRPAQTSDSSFCAADYIYQLGPS